MKFGSKASLLLCGKTEAKIPLEWANASLESIGRQDGMKLKIANPEDLEEGQARSFRLVMGGRYVGCFLVRFQGKLLAYRNKCRHLPISLDYDDARFFDSEKRYLVCQTHGALYQPDTGLCVEGPCRGESLFPVSLEIDELGVYVHSEGDA